MRAALDFWHSVIAFERLVDVECLNDFGLGYRTFLEIYMSFDLCTHGEIQIAHKRHLSLLSQTGLVLGRAQCPLSDETFRVVVFPKRGHYPESCEDNSDEVFTSKSF